MSEKNQKDEKVKFIPTVDYYMKTYALSLGDNDQKAIVVFREYEPQEKVRRLQQELQWIKDGQVAENVLDNSVKKKRAVKYESYIAWARLMLLWLARR